MTSRSLRYYAPDFKQRRHEKLLELLSDIESMHGIDYEEIPTESGYNKDWYPKDPVTSEEEIWKEELRRNQAISRNDPNNRRPSKKFKSNTGNFQISGMIAVVDPEHGVIHASRFNSAMEFLEEVRKNSGAVLDRLHATGRQGKSVHKQLIDNYADWVPGTVRREFPVGESLVESSEYTRSQKEFAKNLVTKRIDLLIERGNEVEIVEAKGKFESDSVQKALGQLLLYEDLYRREHPSEKVRLTAIFPQPSFGLLGAELQTVGTSEAIESLLGVFERNDITVLVMDNEEKFHELQ